MTKVTEMTDEIVVRGYREGDEALILPLFREVFQTERTLDHWRWKFKDNPYGNGKIAEAFTSDGVLAGQYAGYAVPFHCSTGGGKDFISHQIGDIMTASLFRKRGLGGESILNRNIAYFHHKFCIGQVPFNYGFITGKHQKIGEQYLSYQTVSPVSYHVLDLSRTRVKRISRFKEIASGLSVERVTDIGPEYDRFFQKVSGDYRLLVKRDASYLRWRYLACPDRVHRFFAVRRFGKLIGWGVFSVRGDILIWGDALFQRKNAGAVSYMLEHVLKDQDAVVRRIEGWFSSVPGWWTQVLCDAQFEAMPEPNGIVCDVSLFDDRFTPAFLRDHFYFAMGDSDLF